jgi:transposase
VHNVRRRFVEQGVQAAINRKKQKRPSNLRKLAGEAEARLLAIACTQPPEGRARWTLHLLAERLVALQVVETVSHDTVWRTLKKTSFSLT